MKKKYCINALTHQNSRRKCAQESAKARRVKKNTRLGKWRSREYHARPRQKKNQKTSEQNIESRTKRKEKINEGRTRELSREFFPKSYCFYCMFACGPWCVWHRRVIPSGLCIRERRFPTFFLYNITFFVRFTYPLGLLFLDIFLYVYVDVIDTRPKDTWKIYLKASYASPICPRHFFGVERHYHFFSLCFLSPYISLFSFFFLFLDFIVEFILRSD